MGKNWEEEIQGEKKNEKGKCLTSSTDGQEGCALQTGMDSIQRRYNLEGKKSGQSSKSQKLRERMHQRSKIH